MQDALRYLKWEITRKGARIIGCDKTFEGAMAIPSFIDGVPVVEIGRKAFAQCEGVSSVVIPDSVEVVGENAFFVCVGLEELHLGTGIKKLEYAAFGTCVSLKSVVIPDSVEVVGEFAFFGCSGLEELHLGAGIKKLENRAFGA